MCYFSLVSAGAHNGDEVSLMSIGKAKQAI